MVWFTRGPRRSHVTVETVRSAAAERQQPAVFEGVAFVDAHVARTLEAAGGAGDAEAARRVHERLAALLCVDPAGWVRSLDPELVPEYRAVVGSGHDRAAGHGVAWLWGLHPETFRPLVDRFFEQVQPLLDEVAAEPVDVGSDER